MSVATERLYFDADKTKLVVEGDPAAAFLAAAVGQEIPDGFKVPGVKAVATPANKKAATPANKSGSGLTVEKD